MNDAFDLWWEWAEKDPASRLSISADIHGPVTQLSPDDRRDRAKVNEAVRRWRESKTVWIYVNQRHSVGEPDHLKVFASKEAANSWFEVNDPEGVAFEYPVVD